MGWPLGWDSPYLTLWKSWICLIHVHTNHKEASVRRLITVAFSRSYKLISSNMHPALLKMNLYYSHRGLISMRKRGNSMSLTLWMWPRFGKSRLWATTVDWYKLARSFNKSTPLEKVTTEQQRNLLSHKYMNTHTHAALKIEAKKISKHSSKSVNLKPEQGGWLRLRVAWHAATAAGFTA